MPKRKNNGGRPCLFASRLRKTYLFIPHDVFDWLESEAKARDLSTSAFMRAILMAGMRGYKRQQTEGSSDNERL
jgi:hypothetical protein